MWCSCRVVCLSSCVLCRPSRKLLFSYSYRYQPLSITQNWVSIITGTGQALDMGAYAGADESVETRPSSYAKTHETPKVTLSYNMVHALTFTDPRG